MYSIYVCNVGYVYVYSVCGGYAVCVYDVSYMRCVCVMMVVVVCVCKCVVYVLHGMCWRCSVVSVCMCGTCVYVLCMCFSKDLRDNSYVS